MLACSYSQTSAAQNIESLIMPGEVIAAHAEIEAECSACHKRFNRSEQNALCIDCHEDVGQDIARDAGFHGKFDGVGSSECAACHTDHDGRGADIIDLNEETFDHSFTDMELLGKHVETKCTDCHQSSDKHRDAPGECVGCHLDDDVHKESVGTQCVDCHNESDWTDVTFDHDSTDYPLIGGHLEIACLDCHETDSFPDTADTCFGCHAGDDVHEGRSGEQCDNCHNPVSWTDTSFDHARDTDFALAGSHIQLTCEDCHNDDPFDDELDMECVSCHLGDDDHGGHRGSDCAGCHTDDEWPAIHFSHDTETDFELHGSHQEIGCVDCHVEPIYELSPGTNCASCHLNDEPHNGKQGDQCNDCHSEDTWQEAPFFDHDLTRFPLLGEHDNLECESCHETQIFADTVGDCVACHVDEDQHEGRFLDTCGDCHNPVAWDLWLFDHDARTAFILAGAHLDVGCDDCHRSSLASMKGKGNSCADCHRSNDVHDGSFGPNCGRCHSDKSFTEVRSLP